MIEWIRSYDISCLNGIVMTGLCIDTSGKLLTLALWDERTILASSSHPAQQRHSEIMAAELGALLAGSGLAAKDLGVIAVVNGPGSFTGLRVGISFAKGLAMGNQALLVPLNSLEALVLSSGLEDGPASPMLDARRKQIYTALYEMRPESFRAVSEPIAVEPEPWLESLPEGTAVFGSGAAGYRAMVEARGARLRALDGPEEPTPPGLVRLARARLGEKAWAGIDQLDAFYIRKAEAELKSGRP